MPRKSEGPWYRSSMKAYYATISGQQIKLLKAPKSKKNEAEAYRLWEKLVSNQPDPEKGDCNTFAGLASLFLPWVQANRKPKTFALRNRFCMSFVALHGSMPVHALKPFHVEQWLQQATTWGANTKRMAVTSVIHCLRWSQAQGIIRANPLSTQERPAGRSRGMEVIPNDQEYERLLAAADPNTRDFLEALYETGCRPGEVASVTGQHYDRQLRVWLFRNHKTDKTGKVRVVYLSPNAVLLTERLYDPDRPLFRTRTGRPWTAKLLAGYFARARKRAGLSKHLVPYGLRHKWAVDAIKRGVDIRIVAEMLGHANSDMVVKHYGHLAAHHELLHKALDKFRSN